MVELDVRVSADQTLVVIHDETLDRTTTGRGQVTGFTLHELKKLRARSEEGTVLDETIPTLEEVVEALSGFPILIDFNDPNVINPLCDFLRAHPRENLYVSSLLHSGLEMIKDAHPGVPIWGSINKQNLSKDPIGYARALGFQALNFQHDLLLERSSIIQAAHLNGLKVSCWTVNGEKEMEELVRMGVDAIITDEPMILKRIIESLFREAIRNVDHPDEYSNYR